MKDIAIGIVGGTGGMGKWFANFFEGEGYSVLASGRRSGVDVPGMVEKCAVIIVSVPIGTTCDIIEEIGPYMKPESLLMDLTSLKVKPVESMLMCSASEVIGLHPLFGPDVNSIAGHNVVLCPARTERWLGWLKDTLTRRGANVIDMTPERHDELMVLVQGLNHLNTITMGMVLTKYGVPLAELRSVATPLFNTKLAIIKKIFTTNPRLYVEIIALNPHIHKILDLYEATLRDLTGSVNSKNTEAFVEMIEESQLRDL